MRWRVAKKVLRAQARGEWYGRYGTYLRGLRRWVRKGKVRRWLAGRDVAEAARAVLAELERQYRRVRAEVERCREEETTRIGAQSEARRERQRAEKAEAECGRIRGPRAQGAAVTSAKRARRRRGFPGV